MKETMNAPDVIRNFDEANLALLRIGRLEMTGTMVKNSAKERINVITLEANHTINGLNAAISVVKNQLAVFGNTFKNEFEDPKTRKLPFGEIGFRMSKPELVILEGWTEEMIIEKLIGQDMEDFVKITKKLKKNECKDKMRKDQLEMFGMDIKQGDEFFYKVDEAKLETPQMEVKAGGESPFLDGTEVPPLSRGK